MSDRGLLDVRSLSPAQRHAAIFAVYAALAPGESYLLVNDHDPSPLRYQFQAEHPGEFGWSVEEDGPTVWKVEVKRLVAQP